MKESNNGMTAGTPLISVLMTAYNREDYIAEAIESVLASSYTHFELIIVDDCSMDNTVNVAKGYAEKDDRIRVYINDKNLKDYPNRNKAAGYAKGKYLKYCDSDDKLFDWTLGYCVEMMEKYPNAGMGLLKLNKNVSEEYLRPTESITMNFFEHSILGIGPSGTVIRRSSFEQVGRYKPQYGVPSDMYFNLAMAASFPIVLLDKVFFYYRIHDGQELNNGYSYLCNDHKYLRDALRLEDFPLSAGQKDYLLQKARKKFVRGFLSYVKNTGNLKKGFKAFKNSEIGLFGFLRGVF